MVYLLQMDSERGVIKHSAEKADDWHRATSTIGRDFLVKQVQSLSCTTFQLQSRVLALHASGHWFTSDHWGCVNQLQVGHPLV